MYISNFFCFSLDYNCVKKLRDFLKKYENVLLIIYVIYLYKMLRFFCEMDCNYDIDDDYYVNICGLWNFKYYKWCNVRLYDKIVWEYLFNNK